MLSAISHPLLVPQKPCQFTISKLEGGRPTCRFPPLLPPGTVLSAAVLERQSRPRPLHHPTAHVHCRETLAVRHARGSCGTSAGVAYEENLSIMPNLRQFAVQAAERYQLGSLHVPGRPLVGLAHVDQYRALRLKPLD